MIDPKMFDDIAEKLSNAVPSNVKAIRDDLKKNFRSILQGAFAKFDLVTREEFDTQVKVLARTRTKLDNLEKEISAIEKGR